MNTEIDAVVFDFGGVLSSSVGAVMASTIGDREIDFERFLPIMLGPFDDDTDHPWHRMERGEISADQGFAEILSLAAGEGYPDFPTPPTGSEMIAGLSPAEPMIAAARTAREAGYTTAILTNIFHEAHSWRDVCGAEDLVDVIIESCEVGMRKPSRDVFEHTLAALGGVAPERTLFLDDFPWNITGAKNAGLQTLHVTDSQPAAAELLRILDL